MRSFSGIIGNRLLPLALCAPLLAQTSVRQVKVLNSKDAVEIEVSASDRIVPQTRVLTGPDRLVVDFPNSVPGSQLRSQPVDRGEVKDVRVGLFQARPPVTRLVFDLKKAQSYQVFPYGRTVIIKVMGAAEAAAGLNDFPPWQPSCPGLAAATYSTGAQRTAAAAQPLLEVQFHDGLLAINANKATLSEILLAVQQRTGAEISIAAGAEQEKVVASLGPAPAPEVLARLLNGSSFNFLILSATEDPRRLDRVILTQRGESAVTQPVLPNANFAGEQPARADPAPEQSGSAAPASVPGPPEPVPAQTGPQIKASPDDDGPNQ